jgi:hypothetical protein
VDEAAGPAGEASTWVGSREPEAVASTSAEAGDSPESTDSRTPNGGEAGNGPAPGGGASDCPPPAGGRADSGTLGGGEPERFLVRDEVEPDGCWVADAGALDAFATSATGAPKGSWTAGGCDSEGSGVPWAGESVRPEV